MKLFVEKRRHFPNPRGDHLDGIVAMGDEWGLDVLLEAYSFGIFPWPHPDLPCLWFCPDERGVLDFANLNVSKSLKKFYRKNPYSITFNRAFGQVIRGCALSTRPGQAGTWITEPLIRAYEKFHQAGYAQSVEAWQDGQLVGGMYGVYVGGVFSGESMFYKSSNASKVCLLALIEKLKGVGLNWMDIQMLTPLTEKMGGRYIAKADYLDRIAAAKISCRPLYLE